MAKAKRKNVEKLGDVVGKTRPVAGFVLLVIGVFFAVSVLGFAAGQEVFFTHYFEPYLLSTENGGSNLCGRAGATISLAAVLLVGAATYMLPVYVLWFASCCFRHRAVLVSKVEFAAVVVGVLSLSVTAAVFQDFFGSSAPLQSATFPIGWGGEFGYLVWGVLKPTFDTVGSFIVLGGIYLVSLGVVFIESPADAAREAAGASKTACAFVWRAVKAVVLFFALLPVRAFRALFFRRANAEAENGEDPELLKRAARAKGVMVAEARAENASGKNSESGKDAVSAAGENDLIDPERVKIGDIDLRELDDFVRDLGASPSRSHAADGDSALVPVPEVSDFEATGGANLGGSDTGLVDSEEEKSPSNFSGVQMDLSKVNTSSTNPECGAVAEAEATDFEPAHSADFSDTAEEHDVAAEREENAADGVPFPHGSSGNGDTDSVVDAILSKHKSDAEKSAVASFAPSAGSPQAETAESVPADGGAKLSINVIKDGDMSGVDESEDAAKPAPRRTVPAKYVFPKMSLLAEPQSKTDVPKEDYEARITEIVRAIGEFGVKVLPANAYSGPVITRYEVLPAPGVRISRIANLEDDITGRIKAEKVRIIAPVPGRGTVGIEVPNKHRLNVSMREVLMSKQWRETKFEIPIALGKDATGVPIVANLKKMTHALIAGSTNSGKSVCINTIIISMLYKMTPADLRLIMIDPKMVELQVYNTIPHMLIPVVSDVKKAAAALKWLVGEMMRRYQIFNKTGVRNIDGFNAKILKDKSEMQRAEEEFAQMSSEERQAALAAKSESLHSGDVEIPDEKLPYIVCIIDELADLMSVVGKDVEQYIARITQLARAAGIHMIIATQRPDVKVVTGMVKNNLPTRIAFKVTSQIDSRTILDRKGAESLIGLGDMLFQNNGAPDVVRAQGAFLSDEEIEAVVEALKVNGEPQYAEEVQAQIDASDEDSDEIGEGDGGKYGDPMTVKAISVIRAEQKASTSFLQRKLGIGYGRAAKIIDELEDRGIIGKSDATGKREIFTDNL